MGQLPLLAVAVAVRAIAGCLSMKTLGLPEVNIACPFTDGWADPASSPIVVGMVDERVSAFSIPTFTRTENPAAWAFIAMFGYGMGTVAGPTGVLQTSGKPRFCPA